MNERGQRLQRLLAIRTLTAELDRTALRVALSAVAEVEGSLSWLKDSLAAARLAARTALADGRRSEWMMADVQSEAAGWERTRMDALLVSRTEVAEAAMKKFRESRIEHEQVKQLVQSANQAVRMDEERRAQAAADEWFQNKRLSES